MRIFGCTLLMIVAAGGELGIHYDNVTLRPVAIFDDGFEIGHTGAWS